MIDHLPDSQLMLAIEQFYFAYRAFTEKPDRILEQKGLGRVHHRILYFVGRNPGVSVNALLGILDVSKQALNGPLRKLVELDLVGMEAADHDKRIRQLKLTDSGKALEKQLSLTQMKYLSEALAKAGGPASTGWMRVMHQMAQK